MIGSIGEFWKHMERPLGFVGLSTKEYSRSYTIFLIDRIQKKQKRPFFLFFGA